MKIALPRRINAQIALLLLVCVALFHAAVSSILLFFSPGPADPRNAMANTTLSALIAFTPLWITLSTWAPMFSSMALARSLSTETRVCVTQPGWILHPASG
jgi:hypothetical protein